MSSGALKAYSTSQLGPSHHQHDMEAAMQSALAQSGPKRTSAAKS